MKIMNRVTLACMMRNRRRTIVTILGVIISVAMITAVSTFLGTFQDWMRRDAIDQDGDWQVQYLGVAMQDLEVITSDSNTAEAVLGRLVGLAPIENGAEIPYYPYYLGIRAWQTEAFGLRNVELAEGRLPENDHELVVYADFKEMTGISVAVGDTLSLQVGSLYSTWGGEQVTRPENAAETDHFEADATIDYTVVGLIEPSRYGSGNKALTVYTYLDVAALAPSDRVTVTVRQQHYDMGIYEDAPALGGEIAQDGITFNDNLLRVEGIFSDSYLMGTFFILIGIVGTIIFVGSVMLIYNAFAISVSERSRQLGMLASIGATRRQKFGSVFFEGVVIAAISIPIGLLSGIVGIGITFHLIDPMLRELIYVDVPLRVYVSWEAMTIAVILSLLTIFVSLWVPARRASRITPIEAIRQTQDVKLTAKQVKTSKLTRKLFGFEGELALKTLKRNRKRYRVTILSLVISLLLFLTAAGFNHLIGDAFEMTQQQVDFSVSGMIDATYSDAKPYLDALAKLDGVEQMASYTQLSAEALVDTALVSDDLQRYMKETGDDLATGYDFYVTLKALDDLTLNRYAEEVGVDPESLRDVDHPRAILLNAADIRLESYQFAHIEFLDMQAGDPFELLVHNYDMQTGEATLVDQFPIEIAALTSLRPMTESSQGTGIHSMTFFISQAVADRLEAEHPALISDFDPQVTFAIQTEDSEGVYDAAVDLLSEAGLGYMVNDFEEALRQVKQFATMLSVFVYGFVILITLISLAGTFNAISTSVSMRRREFAVLRSVGMDPRSFRRMIHYENLLYGLKSLLYGLPLSAIVMVLMYQALRRNFEMPLSFPWLPIGGAILAIFLIVGLTMLYSMHKLGRETIIEVLRDETL